MTIWFRWTGIMGNGLSSAMLNMNMTFCSYGMSIADKHLLASLPIHPFIRRKGGTEFHKEGKGNKTNVKVAHLYALVLHVYEFVVLHVRSAISSV